MCPACKKTNGILIDMKTGIRSHYCSKLKCTVYWRKSVFSVEKRLVSA